MPLVQHPAAGLPHRRERLRQQGFERFTLVEAGPEITRLAAKLLVAHRQIVVLNGLHLFGNALELALRAVATATGIEPEQVLAAVWEAGDLGQAAEQLLAPTVGERDPSLEVAGVVDTLHEIARAGGSGSQGRKLNLLAGLLALSTPLEARYLLRLVTGN